MARKRKDFVTASEDGARDFLRTLHGFKTVPPSHADVQRLARVMRHFARGQMKAMFEMLNDKITKNQLQDGEP